MLQGRGDKGVLRAAGEGQAGQPVARRQGPPVDATQPGALGYGLQTAPSMDKNTVDMDRERANFVDNSVRYEAALRFINGNAKTMLSAIQGQ